MESTYGPLPGVRGGKLRAPFVSNPTEAMRILAKRRAISAAGDDGAVFVYRDDAGKFRCHFMVRWSQREAQIFTSKASVRRWLAEWMPRCNPS